MFRHVSFAILALPLFAAAAQQTASTAPPPTRPVLRALPLGGDDDLNSKPIEGGEAVIPVQPAAPAKPAAITPPPTPATPLQTVFAPSPLGIKPRGEDAPRLQIFL